MTSRTAAGSLAASLAVPALLLAGCGSSADERREEAFCEEVPGLLSDIGGDVESIYADPQSAPDVLEEAVDRLEAVEPPQDAERIRADLVASWQALTDLVGSADLTDLVGSADLTDPAATTGLAEEATELQGDLVSAGEAVDSYGQENC